MATIGTTRLSVRGYSSRREQAEAKGTKCPKKHPSRLGTRWVGTVAG